MGFLKRNVTRIVVFIAILVAGISLFLFAPPKKFPAGSIAVIAKGSSALEVAEQLAKAHLIMRPMVFQFVLWVTNTSGSIQAGAYRFEMPQNLFVVAYRLTTGSYGMPLVRITFPEGITVLGAAEIAASAFPTINKDNFISAGESLEGYLFPDTYFFSPSADAGSIINAMHENFDEKMRSLTGDISISGHPLEDVVIMASLIEKEARTNEDKRLVSGILWNRFSIGMALQVDAARETYDHTGFPDDPICNPGMDSIEAAINPAKTDYMYYLTGNDGRMYYAKTFDGHQTNLRKYLN